jgi:hypothetical protein
MLDLRPPWFLIDGVLVAPDTADPTQYYYFPSSPHLARDDHGRPAIRLMVYREDLETLPAGQDEAAGFLVLDTALDWPAETLTRVARKIAGQRDLPATPRLVPVPFTAGTVRFFVFDRRSALPGDQGGPGGPGAGPGIGAGAEPGGPGDGTDPDGVSTEWVPRLLAAGMPSLYSDNRAMLSATLSKKAAQLFEAAFGGFVPAGVVYDLTYAGLQPAFDVKVAADWEQVYHHIFDETATRILFSSHDVSTIVDDLVDKKVITFTGTIEGVGDEGMEAQFNEVRKLLQEWVINKFFIPVPNPDQPDDHPIESRVLDTLHGLLTVGSPVDVRHTRRELDMSEIRTFTVDYSIARAVERRIAPQGHLSVVLADSGAPREQVVTVVTGAEDQWRSLEFTVSAAAEFGPAALAQVDVFVWYGDAGTGPSPAPPAGADVWSATLDATHPVATRAAWYRPEAGTSFLYRYEAVFSPHAVVGDGVVLDSGWRRGEGARLTVIPSQLYDDRSLGFETSAILPADLFPEVFVRLRYTDPDAGWTYQDSGVLSANHPLPFAFRTRQHAPAGVDYRLTFLSPGADPIDADWATTSESHVLVGDPRRNLTHVRVTVVGDISRIRQLLIDFTYDDEDNDVHQEGSLNLDAASLPLAHEWVFHRVDPAKRRYRYQQTLVDVDGNLSATGWLTDDRTTLPVGEVYALRWTIRPQLVGPPLTDNNLSAVRVHLHYRDVANGYETSGDVAFAAPGEGAGWALALKDPALRDYDYTVTYVTNTGVERRIGPASANDTFLVVSSVPPS